MRKRDGERGREFARVLVTNQREVKSATPIAGVGTFHPARNLVVLQGIEPTQPVHIIPDSRHSWQVESRQFGSPRDWPTNFECAASKLYSQCRTKLHCVRLRQYVRTWLQYYGPMLVR
jgi:ribosomal protein S16